MKVWQKVLVAMVLAAITGYLTNKSGPLHYDGKELMNSYVLPFGNAFMNLIKLVVVPLIFFVIITGVTSINDGGSFKRIGGKAALFFLFTALVAVVIGVVFGVLLQPGQGVDLNQLISRAAPQHHVDSETGFGLSKFISIFIADNIIGAMATNEHLVQVVFFAIFMGITINSFGAKMQPIKDLCKLASQIFFKMIGYIMDLAPYGVFALLAPMVSTQGIDLLRDLAYLVLVVLSAFVLQYALFAVLLIVIGKLSPWPFFRKMVEVQLVAFSTSSSKATLPTAMRVLNERMGVSETSTDFVLPLAASVNMVGISIYLSICSLFVAQACGIHLEPHQYIILMVTATLGAIGGAGIPGGSIVMMGMVFNSIGLPLGGIAVILGIDRILDMLRTVLNLTCDCLMTVIIDKSEGTFNDKVYNDPNL